MGFLLLLFLFLHFRVLYHFLNISFLNNEHFSSAAVHNCEDTIK